MEGWDRVTNRPVWQLEKEKTRRRRVRNNTKPVLTQDHGWQWDGRSIIFVAEDSVTQEWEARHFPENLQDKVERDESTPKPRTNFSIFDIAVRRVLEETRKAQTCLGQFEVLRAVPKVLPISEEGPEMSDDWTEDEWEKVESIISTDRRTYSEVLRNVDARSPSEARGIK